MHSNYKSSFRLLTEKILDNVLDWAEVIIMSVFVVILFFTYISRIYVVDGNSMNSTLYNNDKLFLAHIMYTPEKGDIVVIDSKVLNEPIVKRVIALEGDTVVIDYNEHSVSINGVRAEENYLKEYMTDIGRFDRTYYNESTGCYEYTVPDNCIFVMGDNRNHSTDSREIGFIPEDEVIGKVFFRISSSYGKLGFI